MRTGVGAAFSVVVNREHSCSIHARVIVAHATAHNYAEGASRAALTAATTPGREAPDSPARQQRRGGRILQRSVRAPSQWRWVSPRVVVECAVSVVVSRQRLHSRQCDVSVVVSRQRIHSRQRLHSWLTPTTTLTAVSLTALALSPRRSTTTLMAGLATPAIPPGLQTPTLARRPPGAAFNHVHPPPRPAESLTAALPATLTAAYAHGAPPTHAHAGLPTALTGTPRRLIPGRGQHLALQHVSSRGGPQRSCGQLLASIQRLRGRQTTPPAVGLARFGEIVLVTPVSRVSRSLVSLSLLCCPRLPRSLLPPLLGEA